MSKESLLKSKRANQKCMEKDAGTPNVHFLWINFQPKLQEQHKQDFQQYQSGIGLQQKKTKA